MTDEDSSLRRGDKVIWVRPVDSKTLPILTKGEFLHYAGSKIAIKVETPTGETIIRMVNPDKIKRPTCLPKEDQCAS